MRMRGVRSALLTLVVSMLAVSARAEVTQPNGLVVPRDSTAQTGEQQVFTLFQSRGEGLNFTGDGFDQPSTFSPLCSFTATLLMKQTGSNVAVGWYNVNQSSPTPPATGDIHVIFPMSTPVGTMITGNQIRMDPAYAGGDVGFALLSGQTHYTESRYNVNCTACTTPGRWVMSIIYASTQLDNAFYVTFEDGNVSNSNNGFGNDGDYNDYVYLFQGLVCNGGGQPCNVPGENGICAQGLTQCVGATTECQQVVDERDETCNGLDDDCDGTSDEGDLCADGQICSRGVCVQPCIEEFGCAGGFECQAGTGLCVETACEGVTCGAGQVCRGGDCEGACDGIVCPGGQACRAGRCADLCESVVCNEGFVCDAGACVVECSCSACTGGEQCDTGSGLCVEAACVGVTCDEGTFCQAGNCVDLCTGAVCPTGQACQQGNCVDVIQMLPDGGVDGDGGAGDGGNGGGDGGVGGDGGGGDGGDGGGAGKKGCGCRTAGAGGGGGAGALVAALGIAFAVMRRRAR